MAQISTKRCQSTDDVTLTSFWASLPLADRELFGLWLSRLVLRAVNAVDGEEDI